MLNFIETDLKYYLLSKCSHVFKWENLIILDQLNILVLLIYKFYMDYCSFCAVYR